MKREFNIGEVRYVQVNKVKARNHYNSGCTVHLIQCNASPCRMKILVAIVSTVFGVFLGSFILPLSKKEPDYYLELKEKEVILFNPSTGDSIHATLDGLSEALLEDNL